MIGIVVVSHSRALADAVVELATQMTGDDGPTVSVAAGVHDGLGTDATAVAEALEEAASPDGVLVLMDLGSAVLSAEMAIEFAQLDQMEIRLSPAPLVEGLVAAVVRAAGGADLAAVVREAESALMPKQSALSEHGGPEQSVADSSATSPDASVILTLINPSGLHARPAATLATALGQLDADVVVAANGKEADGASSLELLALGATKGAELIVSATGPEAQRAVDTARTLVEQGLGELGTTTR